VRTAAQVSEVALRVERDDAVGRVDELDLVVLALLLEEALRLGRIDHAARPLAAFGELAPDLLLDPLEVRLADRLREFEVVVEAVLDRGPDGDLHPGIETPDGLREQVRARVAKDVQRVGVVLIARREDGDALAVFQPQPEVLRATVRAHEDGLLCQLRADRARGVETGRIVWEFEFGTVGENDLHGKQG
jgi:hypothetical protein